MNDKMIALYVTVMERFRTLRSSKSGQTLVEYALILVLIAIVAIASMTTVGTKVNSSFSKAASALS